MRDLLDKRCRRSIATILAALDKEELSPEARSRVRKVILDSVNGFAELAQDVLGAAETGSVMNELWIEKIEELRSDLLAAVRK
jgi:hypothetical protein